MARLAAWRKGSSPARISPPPSKRREACNRAGMTVSLDHLGENVLTREDAERARAVLHGCA